MHPPTPSAHACTQQAALAAAISFIAGFEDDAQQSGVPELLAFLRKASIQAAAPAVANAAPITVSPLRIANGYDTGDYIHRSDGNGNHEVLRRQRYFPTEWEGSAVPWHPSYWWLDAERVTETGQEWRHHCTMVCNDFGYLVAVPDDAVLRPGVAA